MRLSDRKIWKSLRWTSIVLGFSNLAIILLAITLLFIGHRNCPRHALIPVGLVSILAATRIVSLVGSGVVQYATAMAILGCSPDTSMHDTINASRLNRKIHYTKWATWTRFSTAIIVLQFIFALCAICTIGKLISFDQKPHSRCELGSIGKQNHTWKHNVVISFVIVVAFVAMLQCFSGSDVLRWRTFYSTHDSVWKAHYQEVFDHSIREALCCLGRGKYMYTMEEDEVHSVARLLGELVTYRASGMGHLELLTGLSLLETKNQSPELSKDSVDAPEYVLQEAVSLHPFAEAAYTGPLLDVGRTLILFPCVWIYRQGLLNVVWTRESRPVLEGDNWWRGHAAAFLNYVNALPADLKRGRVNQAECRAAYFIVVNHDLKSVIITVRGSETPEDLITDGLCKDSPLTAEDLDGLINGSHIDHNVRESVLSSFPHYGHSGIIEAARELFKQIDGNFSDRDIESQPRGFLSSLLQAGSECEGYGVRIVGHSLGGAIAAVLAMRLYGRYPNLHVYSFGPLPCVDLVVAEACSCFITSIIHDSEFSACLSVNSIVRLRATALTAMSQDRSADQSFADRLARRFIYASNFQGKKMGNLETQDADLSLSNRDVESTEQHCNDDEGNSVLDEYSSLRKPHSTESKGLSGNDISADGFTTGENPSVNPVAQFLERVPSTGEVEEGNPPEMFLPGQVIHLLRQERTVDTHLWTGWRVREKAPTYRAIIADRQNFMDISVSVYMFLDHLPWRCYQAMKEVLSSRREAGP